MCDKPKNKPTHLQWNANRTGPEMYQTGISKYSKMPGRPPLIRPYPGGLITILSRLIPASA
jgi:hypothetical protein